MPPPIACMTREIKSQMQKIHKYARCDMGLDSRPMRFMNRPSIIYRPAVKNVGAISVQSSEDLALEANGLGSIHTNDQCSELDEKRITVIWTFCRPQSSRPSQYLCCDRGKESAGLIPFKGSGTLLTECSHREDVSPPLSFPCRLSRMSTQGYTKEHNKNNSCAFRGVVAVRCRIPRGIGGAPRAIS